MSQAEARAWWADVEHLREAAERRQAADADRRAEQRAARGERDLADVRARSRAAARVHDAAAGRVDELSARRAVALEVQAPRSRRPVPIWLAEDAFADPVATARARAAAPRRTIEIRGQLGPVVHRSPAVPYGVERPQEAYRRPRRSPSLGAAIATRPDRVAFWAFALGLLLTLAAVASPH